MDFSKNDTNKRSVDSRNTGNRIKKKRSAKQIERCRKYRERLSNIKHKNTDTGINPGDRKQNNTETRINPGDGKHNNIDTGINPGDGKQNNTDTGIIPGDGKQNNTDAELNPDTDTEINPSDQKQNNTDTGKNPSDVKDIITDTEIIPSDGRENIDTEINPGDKRQINPCDEKQKNADTGMNTSDGKQINTDTGINPGDGKQNNSDTGINPRDRRPINADSGINPDNENCDKQVVQQPVVPPFQISALYIPGATAMHQPFYFFSPGIIPTAHFVRNTCIFSRNTWNPAMFPSRQSDIDETRGQASAQEIPRIPIEDSATNEDFISSNDSHSQEDDSEIIKAENEIIDINSNDTDNNNTIPDHITSPDNDGDGNRDTDHDIFGIMAVFVNSDLHCVLSKDTNTGNNSTEDKDFGYSYFCMANLLK